MAAESHSKGWHENRDGCDRQGKSCSRRLWDDENQAKQPACGSGFAGNEGTVAHAFPGERTGMYEIEHAAEEIGLPRPGTARKGLEPEIHDQHRAEKQRAERDLQIAGSQGFEGSAVLLPTLDQHPAEAYRHDIGYLEENLPEQAHMRIVIIRENAANLTGSRGSDTLLRHEKHIGDCKIDLWKNRKQPEQHPPEAEENDESITCRARSHDFGETIPAIEATEIYDQGGIPINDQTDKAAAPISTPLG
ncbi:hypothetical protein FHT86_002037 [Rhizobium sp. BK313]|nr:hypothetical protein [Rhizobium sp. BK313]